MKRSLTLIAVLLLLPSFHEVSSAQEKTPEKPSVSATLDEYFSHLEKNNQFMGSVTVLKSGDVVFDQAYGQRALTEAGEPVLADPQTSYGIGSITKMFTSVLINQMVDAGQISLDDKLSKFFPDVIAADQITIDQLLRARRGLKSITATPDYPASSRRPQTRQ
ncbi:MAG: beta-lactamase family protein, partial [Planctomycetaceae bacterium]|nr:beta-lactamase family protein [Planctomycetaceae bacterium]